MMHNGNCSDLLTVQLIANKINGGGVETAQGDATTVEYEQVWVSPITSEGQPAPWPAPSLLHCNVLDRSQPLTAPLNSGAIHSPLPPGPG